MIPWWKRTGRLIPLLQIIAQVIGVVNGSPRKSNSIFFFYHLYPLSCFLYQCNAPMWKEGKHCAAWIRFFFLRNSTTIRYHLLFFILHLRMCYQISLANPRPIRLQNKTLVVAKIPSSSFSFLILGCIHKQSRQCFDL